jgi:hypothetical protein
MRDGISERLTPERVYGRHRIHNPEGFKPREGAGRRQTAAANAITPGPSGPALIDLVATFCAATAAQALVQ